MELTAINNPQVKAAADYVIGPHTADAVALSMQALFNA